MRLRTASGLALVALAGVTAVVTADPLRTGGATAADFPDHVAIVIEQDPPAAQRPAWWLCEETLPAA
jgi:hypothetical protein